MAAVEAVSNLLLDFDDPKAFLDYVSVRSDEEKKKDDDCVVLSTLHSAKGLEWDMVFVAGCEHDLLPHWKSTNIEEERRLFYVGMTRARHQLMMTYARRRNDKAKKASPFLQEARLPENDNVGVFKWSDLDSSGEKTPDASERSSKKAARTAPDPSAKATGSGKRKSYRNRGGKSLIPPDEYGKS